MTSKSTQSAEAGRQLRYWEIAFSCLVDLVRGVHILPLIHCAALLIASRTDALTLMQEAGWATCCALVIAIETAQSIWRSAAEGRDW